MITYVCCARPEPVLDLLSCEQIIDIHASGVCCIKAVACNKGLNQFIHSTSNQALDLGLPDGKLGSTLSGELAEVEGKDFALALNSEAEGLI